MAFKLFSKKKGEENPDKKPKKKKSALREWIDAIVFAVVAATIIRWGLLSAYTIPTSSMEATQLVGDFLFVSKISYGPRTPKTILRLPLTDNKIWGTEIPSYVDWIQLPMLRIPGYNTVQNGHVVVFNYPAEEAPVDMKTHYIKRCIGVGGDTIQVKDGQVFINNKTFENPPRMQFAYFIKSKKKFNERIIEYHSLDQYFSPSEYQPASDADNVYLIHTTPDKAAALEKLDIIESVTRQSIPQGERNARVYPNHPDFSWNEDNFGPLVLPEEGMTIEVNKDNLILYGPVIERYEWNEDVKIEGDKLFIENVEQKAYTFKQDYFFMMGDNRHNSLDSRFWGFVPQDHIVGQAWFTWLSLDYNKPWYNRVRWERVFSGIR